LHIAACVGKQDVMQKIWEWAKERLTTEEIKNGMLLGTDMHMAACGGKLENAENIGLG